MLVLGGQVLVPTVEVVQLNMRRVAMFAGRADIVSADERKGKI